MPRSGVVPATTERRLEMRKAIDCRACLRLARSRRPGSRVRPRRLSPRARRSVSARRSQRPLRAQRSHRRRRHRRVQPCAGSWRHDCRRSREIRQGAVRPDAPRPVAFAGGASLKIFVFHHEDLEGSKTDQHRDKEAPRRTLRVGRRLWRQARLERSHERTRLSNGVARSFVTSLQSRSPAEPGSQP